MSQRFFDNIENLFHGPVGVGFLQDKGFMMLGAGTLNPALDAAIARSASQSGMQNHGGLFVPGLWNDRHMERTGVIDKIGDSSRDPFTAPDWRQ